MLYLTTLYSCWDVVQTLRPAKKQLVLIRLGDWNCWSSLNSGMEVLQLSAVYNLLVTLDKPQYYDSSVFTTDSMQSPFDNLLILRVSKPILSSEDNLLILRVSKPILSSEDNLLIVLCYASVLFLPLFLFGFFFPPFTVVLGYFLLLFLSPLLFRVRSSLSPICLWEQQANCVSLEHLGDRLHLCKDFVVLQGCCSDINSQKLSADF
jgi:hypothetical protein